jgi:hypothetical protein
MEEGDGEFTIAISFSHPVKDATVPGFVEGGGHNGEMCKECFETLRNWLLAPTDTRW